MPPVFKTTMPVRTAMHAHNRSGKSAIPVLRRPRCPPPRFPLAHVFKMQISARAFLVCPGGCLTRSWRNKFETHRSLRYKSVRRLRSRMSPGMRVQRRRAITLPAPETLTTGKATMYMALASHLKLRCGKLRAKTLISSKRKRTQPPTPETFTTGNSEAQLALIFILNFNARDYLKTLIFFLPKTAVQLYASSRTPFNNDPADRSWMGWWGYAKRQEFPGGSLAPPLTPEA